MKKHYLLILVFLLFFKISAQEVPMGINYQAIVRDAVGLPVTNQAVSLRISIRQSTLGGTIVYQEAHSPNSNQFGLVNLVIGSGIVLIGTNLGSINLSDNSYFLQVEVLIGTNWIDLGTAKLQSVPYAIQANNTLKIQNVSVSGVAPTNGQILQYNSTSGLWEPTLVSGVTLSSSTASVTASGTTINIGTASGTSFGILNPTDFTYFSDKISSIEALNGIAVVTAPGGLVTIVGAPNTNQWENTITGPNIGIVYNQGNVSIGANTVSGAKLKVNGDLSAGGQVIASQTINPIGVYNTATPGLLFKQRVYIPTGTNTLNASINAYEFASAGLGNSSLEVRINNSAVATVPLTTALPSPDDVNAVIEITDIDVSAFAGSFQTLEIRAQTTSLAEGVILQGYTFVIKN